MLDHFDSDITRLSDAPSEPEAFIPIGITEEPEGFPWVSMIIAVFYIGFGVGLLIMKSAGN